VQHIDPFDGGPHYEANLDDISLVRAFRTATVAESVLELEAEEFLVARESAKGKTRFRAVRSPVRFNDQEACLPEKTRELLEVKPGDKVSVIPFE
jgi:arginine N-succinyltransferase